MRTWTTHSGYRIIQLLGKRCNVFLVINAEGRSILVDSNRKKNRDKLVSALKEVRVKRIDHLILTHTHYDHAENANFIRQRYGARVVVHQSEADFLEKGNSPLPGGTTWYTSLLIFLFRRILQPALAYEPCKAGMRTGEKQDLSGMGFQGYIMHTPGHSRGSMSLVLDDEYVFAGDAVMGVYPGSVLPLFGEDMEGMVRSWRKLLETGCEIFFPAHGKPVSKELLQKCICEEIHGYIPGETENDANKKRKEK